ncbi:MAG: DcrB-related protein [Waddliaceae bacterium]
MYKVVFLMLIVSLNLMGQETAESMTQYKSVNGYIIEAPESWEVDEGIFGTDVILLAPSDSPNDAFRENMNVMIVPLDVAITRKEFYETSVKGLNQALTNFSLQESKDLTIGGVPALQIVFSHQVGDVKAIVEQYLVMRGNAAFIFTFTAAPDSYDKYLPVFNRIVKSIKFY